jgi:uncharacterized protein (TIGR02265 family)
METSERLVFGHSMAALLDRCAKGLSSEHWAALRALGVERERRLPAYEYERWCRVVEYLAKAVHPELLAGDAEYELGRTFIEVYAETTVGRALFGLLKLLGVSRTIERLARSFRTGTNFTEVETRDKQKSQCSVWFNVVEQRGQFTHGILARGLQLVGGSGVEVELVRLEGGGATYSVRWPD